MTDSVSNTVSKLHSDNDYLELYLNKRATDSKESDSSPSPPSYAVFEDEHGNLVNPALKVTWPVRPHRGRYSLNEYKQRKKRLQSPPKHQRQSKNVSHGHAAEETMNNNNNIYIGVQSESSLSSILLPTEFRLFYMRPDSMNSFSQVPIKMPLMLAYMSSSCKIYIFSFKRHEYNLGTFWQLDVSDIEGSEQPIFRSMSALIKYYKSFAIDRDCGKSETIPVD